MQGVGEAAGGRLTGLECLPHLNHRRPAPALPPSPPPPPPRARPPTQDVKKGSIILCADGSISLEVLATNPAEGTVRVKCLNTATLG